MAVVATASRGRYVRLLVITVVALAMGAFFAYDGWIRYPRQNTNYARQKGIENFIDANGNVLAEKKSQMTPQQREDAKGMPHSGWDIPVQKILAGVCLLLAAAIGLFALYVSRDRVAVDDDGISIRGRPPIGWAEIESLDKSRYEKQGVLLVRHSRGTLKLDPLNLEPLDPVTDEIIHRFEQRQSTPEA